MSALVWHGEHTFPSSLVLEGGSFYPFHWADMLPAKLAGTRPPHWPALLLLLLLLSGLVRGSGWCIPLFGCWHCSGAVFSVDLTDCARWEVPRQGNRVRPFFRLYLRQLCKLPPLFHSNFRWTVQHERRSDSYSTIYHSDTAYWNRCNACMHLVLAHQVNNLNIKTTHIHRRDTCWLQRLARTPTFYFHTGWLGTLCQVRP